MMLWMLEITCGMTTRKNPKSRKPTKISVKIMEIPRQMPFNAFPLSRIARCFAPIRSKSGCSSFRSSIFTTGHKSHARIKPFMIGMQICSSVLRSSDPPPCYLQAADYFPKKAAPPSSFEDGRWFCRFRRSLSETVHWQCGNCGRTFP